MDVIRQLLDLLPDPAAVESVTDRTYFKVDYTLFLNAAFIMVSGVFFGWALKTRDGGGMGGERLSERILFWLAMVAFAWLAVGGVLAWTR